MELGEQAGLTILIAERHRMVAESLGRIISAFGNAEIVAEVSEAQATLEAAEKAAPDVALVDGDLSPDCSLIRRIRRVSPETRVIVLADRESSDPDALVNALASGAVGAMYKQASIEELQRALQHSSPTSPAVSAEVTGLLLGSYLDALTEKRARDLAVIEALAGAVEVRDLTTGLHLHRVTEIAQSCVERLDPQLAHNEELAFGFTLHDIGKIGVPDAILNKPGPLDESEWAVMRRHPELGAKIVQPIGFSESATDVILWHHERWDGTGYPHGLRGEEIPLAARAFAIADAYDAMTTDRPYRGALPASEALDIITTGSGSAFDPVVVDVFLDLTA